MPIYEFYSPKAGKIYSFFARSLKYTNVTPVCPDGRSFKMHKLISGFSITSQTEKFNDQENIDSISKDDAFDDLPPEKAGAIMKELEGSMQGMDDENPDPRQMGSLMRRMCELTGEKMDEPMEEVIRKLEEGSDPEAFEDQMDGFMTESSEPSSDEENVSSRKIKSKIRKLIKKRVIRDPNLYEFSDYTPVS